MLSLLLFHALGACPEPATAEDVVEVVNQFENSVEKGDAASFQRAQGNLIQVADCIGERLDPSLIARYFRARGLDSYVTGRTDTASLWWAAARRLDPNATLPIYPQGHEANDVYTALDPNVGEEVRLPPPRGKPFLIDGAETRNFPLPLPTLLQRESDNGFELQVVPAGQLPTYKRKRPVRVGLVAASGLTLIGSVASLLVASSARSSFDEPQQSFDALAAHRARTNRFSTLTLTLGGLAVGTGVAGIVVKR